MREITGYAFAVGLVLITVAVMFHLLRSRRIREKYVGWWLTLAGAVILLVIFPGIALWLTRVLGVQTPTNLIFAVALAVLLVVCIHLSVAISSLEERNRTLVEEVAFLRYDIDRLRDEVQAKGALHTEEAGGTPPPVPPEIDPEEP